MYSKYMAGMGGQTVRGTKTGCKLSTSGARLRAYHGTWVHIRPWRTYASAVRKRPLRNSFLLPA